MSQFLQKFKNRNDIWGILWLAGAILLALSLCSYNPRDPSFDSVGNTLLVQNDCGYFGSFLADLLYQLFGLAAWLPVLTAVQMTCHYFKATNSGSIRVRVLWELSVLLTCSSLLALYWPHQMLLHYQIHLGGVLGMLMAKVVLSIFNPVGASVVLWCLAALLAVFYFDRPLLKSKSLLLHLFAALAQVPRPKLSKINKINKINKKTDVPLSAGFSSPAESDQAATETIKEEKTLSFFSAPISNPLPVKRKETKSIGLAVHQVENWKLPELRLLEDRVVTRTKLDDREIERKSTLLVDKLAQFGVKGEVVGLKPGPAVTMFEFKPNADVKISRITELADDLSLALSSESVRIIAPIPGRDVVGIETSNSKREAVFLKDNLESEQFWSDKTKLPLALGQEANGDTKVVDLRKMPHLLVAGTTGSGKSVFVVSAITGLLFRHSPKTLRLILIDPKQVDLAAFNRIPHLLMPPIRETKKAVSALRWAIREMDKRYRSMSRFGARNIEGFNEVTEALTSAQIEEHQKANESSDSAGNDSQYYYSPQPYLIIVVEEFGDLMAVDRINVEQAVVRLAQMARACGIHLILAMQSPRKDVVTGLIKTNIPGRISFKVASKMDSRIILDDSGAERLLAQGDMLFLAPGVAKPQRHHGPWVSEVEISGVMKFWAAQGEPQYESSALRVLEGSGGGYDWDEDEAGGANRDDNGEFSDEEFDQKYDEILSYVSTQKEVSASLLQRRFRLGYPRAARMIEIFEREGVVGPANGSKPRSVLVNNLSK